MDFNDFDSIKSEKAIAVRNFSRWRKLKWISAFCIFFILISRSSTWFSFAGPIYRQLVSVLNSHVFIFMLFNAMIFVVYSLSNFEKTIQNNPDSSPGITAVGESESPPEPLEATPVADVESIVEKHTVNVISPVAIAAISEKEEAISPLKKTDTKTEIVRYRRTESEKLKEREMKKLRRTKTEIRGERETPGGGEEAERISRWVNEMDMENFNRTVESYIAKKKLLQREELREEQKKKIEKESPFLALTLSEN